jgi:lipid-binding SYLF domain-containing protein
MHLTRRGLIAGSGLMAGFGIEGSKIAKIG